VRADFVKVINTIDNYRFEQFDSARTGQLSYYDLQRLLAKDATMDAREDCVKMLMSKFHLRFGLSEADRADIFDTDRSGSINYAEFEGLYRYIIVRIPFSLPSHH
jgi:hypothetical protein